jgi:spermidine/putrescine transport system ATP-binding protein
VRRDFGSYRALKSISMAVGEGEFVAIMGPSGCGKSTLLRLIAGLDRPSSGSISIAGRPMEDVPAHRRDTPMVWQSLALFPFMNALDNVAFPLRMRGVEKAERRRRAAEWLERLGLGGMERRFVTELSGGQLQRVALARALVIQPRVLLLDEPLSALDPHLRVRMQNELARLHRDLGITFIYVTHSQSEAFALADRVIIMNAGKVQQVGAPMEIHHKPANRFVVEFLGTGNVISGTVTDVAGDWLKVNGELGALSCRANRETRPGEKASFSLLADRLKIAAPDSARSADLDAVDGTVLGHEYVGSMHTVFVNVGGAEFKILGQTGDFESLATGAGQKVRLEWSPADTWQLQAE